MASEVGELRQTCHCVCFDIEEEVVAALRCPSSGKEECTPSKATGAGLEGLPPP